MFTLGRLPRRAEACREGRLADQFTPLSGVSPLVNVAAFICLAVWMMSVGCATKSPPVLVAYGRLVSQRDDIKLRVARYEVSEVQRGHLATNVVEVVFWRKTQVGELPREAILLLSRPPRAVPAELARSWR